MFKISLIITLVVALLFGLNVSLYADQMSIDKIESAYLKGDTTMLETLTKNNQGYDSNLAGYRLALVYGATGKSDLSDKTLQQVVQSLENHLSTHPNDVESWALLTNAYGVMIAFDPNRGMSLGPKTGAALSRALSLDKENPRVQLVAGVSKFYTPEEYGGSKTEAITLLTGAIESYARANDRASGYHWGLPEAHIWRGIARAAIGESEKAVIEWREALKVAPEHPWAKQLLENSKANQ